MKLSIVSTVYNKEAFLDAHIKSLINQTYNDIEFIFVNDGSTDSSLKILKKYKNIKIINQENHGANYARKVGFKNSVGDYVYFVDSDDTLYDNDVILNIAKIIKYNKDIDCIFTKMINSYQNKDEIDNCIYYPNITKGKYNINQIYDGLFRNSLCFKIFKRDKIKEDYFIPEKNYEDCYLSYRILNDCKNLYYYDKPIYVVNRKDNNFSITKTFNLDNIDKKYQIINRLKEESINFKESLEKLYVKSYLDDLYNSLKNDNGKALELLQYLKSKKIKIELKQIASTHYFKIFIFRRLYENYNINRAFQKVKMLLLKVKKMIRR